MKEVTIKSKSCPKCGGEGVLISLDAQRVFSCNDCDYVAKGKWRE